MNDLLKRRDEETVEEYKERIYSYKRDGKLKITWDEITYLFSKEIEQTYSSSKWRRDYNKWRIENDSEDDLEDSLNNLLFEIQKERIKNSDERTQTRAYIRRLSREETLKEIGMEAALEVSKSKPLLNDYNNELIQERANYGEGILMLSDWHFGIDINNPWNIFNEKICRERVSILLKETIAFCYTFGITKLYLVNLGDLIAGRIHSTIRLESRCDVITQTITVSEILSEFITAITNEGIFVEYHDCLDNHSRLEPNKGDSLDLESLVRIIPWYLKTRCADNELFNCNDNEYGEDIITFSVLGGKYEVAGVHGHKDKPSKVVQGLTMMTKTSYDLILTAHLHHFSCDELNDCIVVSNGSLMGVDSYAKDLRLSSRPSQNLIFVSPDSVVDYIHRVILD